MAAGGEQTRSAHARDVSLGARIITCSGTDIPDQNMLQNVPINTILWQYPDGHIGSRYRNFHVRESTWLVSSC